MAISKVPFTNAPWWKRKIHQEFHAVTKYEYLFNPFLLSFMLGCARFSLLHTGFLQVQRGGYSRVVMHRLLLLQSTGSRHASFSSCDIIGLSGSLEYVEYSKTGTEPVSPALAGRLLSIAPPGKLPNTLNSAFGYCCHEKWSSCNYLPGPCWGLQ